MDNYSSFDLFDFLRQANINYRQHGKEAVLDRCPYCEQSRQGKSAHFSFNVETGVYHCVKCNIGGNLITFKRDQGFDPFEYKVYHKPDQTHAKAISTQPDDYYKKYSASRKIPEEVIKRYGVGMFMDEKLGACRTYQYVDFMTGEVVNIKYINKNKQMKTTTNPRRIYYGLQFVDFTLDCLYVCEGEDDCHAMAAMGFDNVVSVPFGCNHYSEEMGAINKRFKKIVILFDNDKSGQEGALKFSEKAGVWKCFNCVLPFKDIRDCYINGLDYDAIKKIIDTAKQFEYNPEIKDRPALSIAERITRFETDAKTNRAGVCFGFNLVDDITGGLRGGDVMTIIANPGCFKTTMLMNMLKRAIDKTSSGIAIFFSLEMQIEAEFEREIQILTRFPHPWLLRDSIIKNDPDWNMLKTVLFESSGSRIYVSEKPNTTIDGMAKIIKNTEESTGQQCIMVGIDYLDFVGTDKGKEYDAVKEVMNGLKQNLAKKLNIPTIMLCQTNRDNKEGDAEVSARSGKGGTAIEASSDFTIGLWRSNGEIVGRFVKHRRHCSRILKEFPYFKLKKEKKGFAIDDLIECEKPIKDIDVNF